MSFISNNQFESKPSSHCSSGSGSLSCKPWLQTELSSSSGSTVSKSMSSKEYSGVLVRERLDTGSTLDAKRLIHTPNSKTTTILTFAAGVSVLVASLFCWQFSLWNKVNNSKKQRKTQKESEKRRKRHEESKYFVWYAGMSKKNVNIIRNRGNP